ncbi:MAG: multidrug ABC transporter ATP-binding protein [Actinobacteria bacterium HGW-Actinobacteria-1]|nr:MAG: multidrug ABC transporter ATP-binding protein [Actinobacteria bacterium HGW-Actinobacteria-1]
MPAADAAHAIEVHGLRKTFGDFVAVNSVDFNVGHGEIFGFLGPNGSGKTTTIRMLCGVIAPTDGGARVMGYDVCSESERVRENIGYMSQKFSLFQDLTVDENLKFYAGVYGLSDEKFAERREYILTMADLHGRENEMTGDLSVGWKQRLALGCATIHEPKLIFLDEPTSGVDPMARRQFWELLHDLAASGVTLFVTTHYMDEATHCNRLAFIYRGDIIAEGTPNEVKGALMRDTILQVEVDDGEGALAALEGSPGIGEAYMQGSLVHVNIGERTAAEADLPGLLGELGFDVHSVEPVEPTLEDAFVHLVTRQKEASS